MQVDTQTNTGTDLEVPLKPHPLCKLFPPLSGEGLKVLADDIKALGQRDPIVLYEGMILDGRNRYEACRLAGERPKFKEFDGGDPLDFIISKNMKRRNLDKSQRALIAVELETLAHGGDRRETKLLLGISRAEAAGMMGVSEGYVRDAKYVKLHGSSETIEAVRRGEMTLSAAKAKIKKAAGGGKAKAIADDAANKVTAEQTEPSEPGSSCTEADREAARELLDWLVASCDPDQCAELAELAEKAGPYYGQMCRDLANRLQERAAEANWQEGAKAA